MNIEDFHKEYIAQINGATINDKMVKDAEISGIKRKYILAEELTDAYNHHSETFPSTTDLDMLNNIREETLNAIKYALYYDTWNYYE